MFETFDLYTLQQYWWLIVSLLGSLLVFLMFVQGGQTLIYTLGKTESERTMIINTLGRKWEFTFTTLVTFGGAFFASFPLFYSTSFGGAYWVWMAILIAFVVQAIAYEYRKKPGNVYGHRTFEVLLLINGLLGTVLIGTAVGTFFTGAEFSIHKMNLTQLTDPVISRWESPFHGLEAVLDFRNVALGLAVFFLSRILGALYIANTIEEANISNRVHKQLWYNGIPFLIFFLYFVISLVISPGFAVDPVSGVVSMENYKYLHNLVQMPIVGILFLAGVVLVLLGLIGGILNRKIDKMIWPAGIGTVFTVLALLLVAGYNHTAFYPSTYDLQSSLTIANASSSHYTLSAMSYVSLMVPFVLAYIVYAWRAINNKKVDAAEMDTAGHVY